ncbi:MAG: Cj0069 family protein [Chloroflexi bacterium]|nr:Cj0069 family protein [Chloroflexota bacterium]
MADGSIGRVGVLWRGDRDARDTAAAENNRLRPVFDALDAAGVAAEPVVFGDETVDEARAQLLRLDGVLVWVDPIMGDQDRTRLDALLRDVATAGVWVSAHPDTILKMGTKEVLFRTRDLGWGGDIHRYRTVDELKKEFPSRLAASGPRVLKQNRGNGGIGVWKVELAADAGAPGAHAIVRVQHARPRDTVTEELPLGDFIERCRGYFDGAGRMVDQPFQPRIAEGMIRCYMVRDEVAGFAHQWPESPGAVAAGASAAQEASRNILGLPARKTMYEASEPRFAALRVQVESEWVPGMQRLLALDADALPLLWDADFLYGPRTEAGADTYVLCEINVSSVLPFPEAVPEKLARAVVARLAPAGRPATQRPPALDA